MNVDSVFWCHLYFFLNYYKIWRRQTLYAGVLCPVRVCGNGTDIDVRTACGVTNTSWHQQVNLWKLKLWHTTTTIIIKRNFIVLQIIKLLYVAYSYNLNYYLDISDTSFCALFDRTLFFPEWCGHATIRSLVISILHAI